MASWLDALDDRARLRVKAGPADVTVTLSRPLGGVGGLVAAPAEVHRHPDFDRALDVIAQCAP